MALSSRFGNETMSAILERMLSRIPDDIDKRQGSIVYDMLAPAAAELAQVYMALDLVLMFGFASEDMPREYLELRAAELGITPHEATKATGKVTFSGPDGMVIPKGTRVSTDEINPKYFVTIEDGMITSGTVTVNAEAEQAGASGNVTAGEITIVLGDLSGVLTVTNTAAFEGGADAESDESLLERYFQRAKRAATSGNEAHYEQWALEVPGVGDAVVIPLWNGPSTVKVIIVDSEKKPATSELVSAVASHIEESRPIGAAVTVVSATGKPIDVMATVTLASGYTLQQVQDAFTQQLEAYLRETAFKLTYVSYARIGTLLLGTPGVLDYMNLIVNGGTTNVALQDEEVPVLGTVTLGV